MFMKIAVKYISPGQVVLLRVVAGFLPLLFYSLYKRTLKAEHIANTHHFVVMSFLATSVYFFAFVKGTELLYSGVAGAVSGSIPLFSFIAAVIFLEEESFGKEKLIGCLMALVGISLITKPFSGTLDNNLLLGVSWMALGSLSLGLSFVYAKKYIIPLNIENSALVTYQLGIAAVFLLLATNLEDFSKLSSNGWALTSTVVGLGVIGTGLAYVIYYYLVDALGAVKAASVTYLPPVVALVIAVLIVGEPLVILDYVGAALILSGIYVLNKYNK
jgi:drug/metabolite transporter (DMT)-like permease